MFCFYSLWSKYNGGDLTFLGRNCEVKQRTEELTEVIHLQICPWKIQVIDCIEQILFLALPKKLFYSPFHLHK